MVQWHPQREAGIKMITTKQLLQQVRQIHHTRCQGPASYVSTGSASKYMSLPPTVAPICTPSHNQGFEYFQHLAYCLHCVSHCCRHIQPGFTSSWKKKRQNGCDPSVWSAETSEEVFAPGAFHSVTVWGFHGKQYLSSTNRMANMLFSPTFPTFSRSAIDGCYLF